MLSDLSDLIAARYQLVSELAGLDPAVDADSAARRLAARLADGEPEAAHDAVTLAFGDGEPPAEWYSTPVGRAVALATEREQMPVSRAAVLLGVTHQRAHQLARAGRLDRHPDGGVTVASVRALLAERA